MEIKMSEVHVNTRLAPFGRARYTSEDIKFTPE
jgi:hypothetical protein